MGVLECAASVGRLLSAGSSELVLGDLPNSRAGEPRGVSLEPVAA